MATPTKVALVTASSAGLGAAIARALAPRYRVAINYNSSPAKAQVVLDGLNESFPQQGGQFPRFRSFKCDLGNREDVHKLVEDVAEQMGGIDVLVSNGGWTEVRGFTDLDANAIESDWDTCWNINVKSHMWLLHAAKKYLEAGEDSGCFVTVASTAGVKPSGSSLPYAVSKAAQIHLAKSLAVMVGPKIRVNSVSPGLMLTEWGMRFGEEAIEKMKEKNVLKRFAPVEEVADVVKMIVQSPSMTGQNLVIDGGFTTS